jgi:hypothetical protein
MLLAGQYASGIDAPFDLSDSVTYALRFDYAMAGNLTCFFSVLKANRVSHGYGWGFVRPLIPPENINEGDQFGRILFQRQGGFSDPIPAIPDNDL